MALILRIEENDTLAVALAPIAAGQEIKDWGAAPVTAIEDIKPKQKICLIDVAKDDTIFMYGVPVGKALVPLKKGQGLLKEHIEHSSADFSASKWQFNTTSLPSSTAVASSFNGYLRADGKVGTRNYWLVIPLVFCENNNIQVLQQAFTSALGYGASNVYEARVKQLLQHHQQGKAADSFVFETTTTSKNQAFENIDGIKFLTHSLGCGGSREDARTLCKLIAGYIVHPNVGGATVLSLGCQNATIDWLKEALQEIQTNDAKPLIILEQQGLGSNENLLNVAIDETFKGLCKVNEISRTAQPISKLTLGLKCGGSDGFSGISANPALGYASDLLVQKGGSAILAEFPELCGVEQELINRCVNQEDAAKFEQLMRYYATLSEKFGNPFHMNPSEGNIKDGLLTDAMKSAGAAKKGGTASIAGVLDYTEQMKQAGLHLLCTPGNDVEATTGIAGSGANVIVFTTGLGTPTGNPICPTLKISSNNSLATKMPDVIDFSCGNVIEGEETVAQCGERLLQKIIQIANGELACAEQLQQDDFIPWRKSISV